MPLFMSVSVNCVLLLELASIPRKDLVSLSCKESSVLRFSATNERKSRIFMIFS